MLLNNNASHVAYVLRLILDALIQYDIRSPEFRDLVRPHFGTFTDHFVHELLNYAQSSFDLVGYDQSVTYLPQGMRYHCNYSDRLFIYVSYGIIDGIYCRFVR